MRKDNVPEIDCSTCTHRGEVEELIQETYCSSCKHQSWLSDYYKPKDESEPYGWDRL